MTDQIAPWFKHSRLAAVIAAAGFLLATAASAQTVLPPPAYGSADARQDRIEELEGQLRDATAQNEVLQHQLNDANREITRLRGMVGELAGVNQSLSAGPPANADEGAADQDDQGKPDAAPSDQRSELNDAQRRATGTLGSIPAGTEALPPPPARDPADVYSEARQLLNNGRLAEAEAAFSDYVDDFPDTDQTPDARYLLAYTQLARNSYDDAASGFVDYLRRYPRGARAPDAQVRLGMALNGMGQTRQACAAWADVPTRYPRAAQQLRDRAASESRAAHCPTA